MANPAYTRNQVCFPVLETTFGTAATPVGADACLITSLTTQANQGEIPRPDKTGSLGEILGIAGRKTASWSASMSMAGNGAAGVLPDMDVFLQLIMGKVATIVSSTSVTYALDDNNYSASIWHYNDPSTVAQYLALSAYCSQIVINFGGDVPTFEFSGPALWILDTDQLADGTMDSVGKGGITTWTARPTPSVNGAPPQGFVGSISLDGNAYTTLRSGRIVLAVGRNMPGDTFNSFYSAAAVPGLRTVSVDFGLYDDDSANLKTLKQKSFSHTGATPPVVDLAFQIGTVVGNRWTNTCKNVKLPAPVVDQGSDRRALSWSGARAHDTSIGAKDAFKIAIT